MKTSICCAVFTDATRQICPVLFREAAVLAQEGDQGTQEPRVLHGMTQEESGFQFSVTQ